MAVAVACEKQTTAASFDFVACGLRLHVAVVGIAAFELLGYVLRLRPRPGVVTGNDLQVGNIVIDHGRGGGQRDEHVLHNNSVPLAVVNSRSSFVVPHPFPKVALRCFPPSGFEVFSPSQGADTKIIQNSVLSQRPSPLAGPRG